MEIIFVLILVISYVIAIETKSVSTTIICLLIAIGSCVGIYWGAYKTIEDKEIKSGQVWINEYEINSIPPDTITIIEIKNDSIKYKLYEDTFFCKHHELPLSEDSKLIKK
jgi:hypothetical protein